MKYKKVHNKTVYEVKKFLKTKKHIVIIEDDPFTKDQMVAAFKDKYHMSIMDSAEDAAYFIEQNVEHIDLIITTHKLKHSTEEQIWDIVEKIKTNEKLKHIPIVLQREAKGLSKTTQIDFAAFIAKPYGSPIIAELVNKVFSEEIYIEV